MKHKHVIRTWYVVAAFVLVAVVGLLACIGLVTFYGEGTAYERISQTPKHDVAVVLGHAPYHETLRDSLALESRVKAAAGLYRKAKVDYVLLMTDTAASDDNSLAIEQMLVNLGVDRRAIRIDGKSRDLPVALTRARDVYGLDTVFIVADPSLNARAFHAAKNEDVNIVAFNAAETPSPYGYFAGKKREYKARIKLLYGKTKPDSVYVAEVDPFPDWFEEVWTSPRGLADVADPKRGMDYSSGLVDRNSLQMTAATANGVSPMKADTLIPYNLDLKKLVEIHSNRYFIVAATQPYLTPTAAHLLDEIGARYQKALHSRTSRFVVTSALRTKDYVASLMKRNGNAVRNSTHLYGTTFDIAYNNLDKKEKAALSGVLQKLREKGYCYVVHEYRQPCFHVTVRK